MRFFSSIVVLLFSLTLHAQKLEFGFSLGSNAHEGGTDLITDAAGNIYVVGRLTDSLDFDPGPGVQYYHSNSVSGSYLAKYNPIGNLIWCHALGGPGQIYINHVILDDSANIYVAGRFFGKLDFNPGLNSDTLNSYFTNDGFISKYDRNGNYLWSVQIGGGGSDILNSLNLSDNGSILVGGQFQYTVDFDPDTGTNNLVAIGSAYPTDLFFASYSTQGSLNWAYSMGGPNGIDNADDLVSAGNNEVILAGYHHNNCDLNPGNGVHISPIRGAFFGKYKANGDLVWVKEFNLDVSISNLRMDSKKDIIVAGDFDNTVDFDPGAGTFYLTASNLRDNFLAKYDFQGNFLWAFAFGDLDNDYISDLQLDRQNNIYISGTVKGDVDFDPGLGTALTYTNGSNDGFFAKYKKDGTLIFAKRYDSDSDSGNRLWLDDEFSIFIFGTFVDSMDIDFDPSRKVMLAGLGLQDVFFAKYSQCIEPDVKVVLIPPPQCKGDLTTLRLDSSFLNSATNWVWYADSCAGNVIGTGDSLQFTVDSTHKIFVRGEGGCLVNNNCDTVILEPIDTEPPDLICPNDTTLYITPPATSAILKELKPIYADNCSSVDLTYSLSGSGTGSGTGELMNFPFQMGETIVHYVALDSSWNANSCEVSVVVSYPIGLSTTNRGSPEIYPNPGNGKLTIRNISFDRLEIRDIAGRQVNFDLTNYRDYSEIAINSEPGMYLLYFTSDDRQEVKRIVIK